MESERGESAKPSGRERVLVVEDEPGMRRLYARLLDGAGYGVLEAEDVPQALEILADPLGQLRVVVLDADLNGLPGELLAAHLKQTRPELRLIVCSADTSLHAFDAILDAGADIFLPKPLPRLTALAAAVDVLLASRPVPGARSA